MTNPSPVAFNQVLSHPGLLDNLEKNFKYTHCTPIQASAIPSILTQKDLRAGAKTGSGKTLAFIAPVAQLMLENKARKTLVLSPTRELALQSDDEAAKLLEGVPGVVSVPLYGGVPISGQIRAIRHHQPRLYIATPGRMIDLYEQGIIDLSEIDIVILDEADRLCDMGFTPQIRQILKLCTQRKQILLFSATLPKALNEIMDEYCPNPEVLMMDDPEEASSTITHTVIRCSRHDRVNKLLSLLKTQDSKVYGIIFTRTRSNADELYKRLQNLPYRIEALHAGYSMGERERSIRAFKEKRLDLLIATDVLSRGIDVSHLTHVIHFDLPQGTEDYIHRSGRSGRAGRQGQTFAFYDNKDPKQTRLMVELDKKIIFEEWSERSSAPKPNEQKTQNRTQHSSHQSSQQSNQQNRQQRHSRNTGPRVHTAQKSTPRRSVTLQPKNGHITNSQSSKSSTSKSLWQKIKSLIKK